MDYSTILKNNTNITEALLTELLADEPGVTGEAMRYSLLGGGKRVRANLVLAVCDMLHGDEKAALLAACAIECLHCYSLIHDDLPCMDNDDYRRGKPSCHKQFGEATALLAGDALLTKAFELLAHIDDAEVSRRCTLLLSKAAGSSGMVYGQELDLIGISESSDKKALLDKINKLKTGCLIEAAVLMGAACAKADREACDKLSVYANAIGLVFQIVDDVLDVTSSLDELGKMVGSDKENDKVTYAELFGCEGAMNVAGQLTHQAVSSLEAFGDDNQFLVWFAKRLLTRKK